MPKGVYQHKKGYKLSAETRRKNSEAKMGEKNPMWGKHLSIEHKRRLSETLKGKIAWNKGKHYTEETKKMSEAHKGKKLSEETKRRMSESRKGEKHWNWKGGHFRTSTKYKEWRIEVLLRDNFTCVICGKVGGDLEVHHIKSWAKFPELQFDINNSIVVCKECHMKIDKFRARFKK